LEKLAALLQVGQTRIESTGQWLMFHDRVAFLAALALLAATAQPVAAAAASSRDNWVGAWGFPAISFIPTKIPSSNTPPPPTDFDNATVRQIVRLSHRAQRIRIRISNEFGEQSMLLGSVHVALAGDDGSTIAGSDHALTFSGQPTPTIPAGAPLLSDPLDWDIPALTKLAISIYVPGHIVPPAHRASEYVSAPGNFVDAPSMPDATLVRSGALVSQVDIVSSAAPRAVVTFGDSITEGFGSSVNEFRSWSDRLAERLVNNPKTRDWAVVNAGVNSNRLLHNGPGSGALTRFDRDVLSTPGVAAIILLEGINDIGYSTTLPSEAITPAQLIGAYEQLIQRAHMHGIAVIGATITPYEGAHYYAPSGEQMRQAVNAWIRGSRVFDGVIDFDAALRDPAHPSRVLPALERGDHLHPNDAGYATMAEAIDLKLFSSPAMRH
jgi:lysophospholipase L1-like esterase